LLLPYNDKWILYVVILFKKVLIITITVVLLAAVAFWSPWTKWDISLLDILGLENEDDYAGLQVYSISGELQLEIDNEIAGNVTLEGSPLDIFEIEPGDHLITIKRVSEEEGASQTSYYEFTRMVNFVRGINTVVAYEIGPSTRFSGGYIIYATPAVSEDIVSLNLRTEPENAQIFLNDIEVSSSPMTNYELDLSQNYKIRVVKDNNESIEFDLLPETEEEKNLLVGYDLNVDINLFELPLEVRQEDE